MSCRAQASGSRLQCTNITALLVEISTQVWRKCAIHNFFRVDLEPRFQLGLQSEYALNTRREGGEKREKGEGCRFLDQP
ncbi:MAG: hypothetical protein ACKESB_01580 [Candidatus Hodgkinia cicadicola]